METEGPLGGGQRPAREPDVTLVVTRRDNFQLFLEWSGAAHPLSADTRICVWTAGVATEPETHPINVSPHPEGLVVYLNDLVDYYEVWRGGDLVEDAGWLGLRSSRASRRRR